MVLVHSYGGDFDDQFVATGLFDALAAGHRTIGFDLRGHGRSDKPHDAPRYGARCRSTSFDCSIISRFPPLT